MPLGHGTFRYALVARETVKLYYEIVESEGWSDSDKIYLSPFNCHMAKVSTSMRLVFTTLI